MSDEITAQEAQALGAKLNAFAEGLEPREQAMLAELLAPLEDGEEPEVDGFSFDTGLEFGLNQLIGGTVLQAESGGYNRWNRTTTSPPPTGYNRWNRTTK